MSDTEPEIIRTLIDATTMQAIDSWAINDLGIPSLDLMERAGTQVAHVVNEAVPEGRVVVVCGKGNNGGDGLVCARIMRGQGREVDVVALWPRERISEDAKTQWDRLEGRPPIELNEDCFMDAAIVIDAMVGTGFAGAPRGQIKAAVEQINGLVGIQSNQTKRSVTKSDAEQETVQGDVKSQSQPRVFAIDLPTGVDASTGEVVGSAIQADFTLTFHRCKIGQWVMPGKSFCGELRVLDIGIPKEGGPQKVLDFSVDGSESQKEGSISRAGNVVSRIGLIISESLKNLPDRTSTSTKFTSGNLIIIGGSPGLLGAPILTAMGAMRSGAGYISIATPKSLLPVFSIKPPEVMLIGISEDEGTFTSSSVDEISSYISRADAVVIGPGLGREKKTQDFVRSLISEVDKPIVVDADALNALAGQTDKLSSRSFPTIITPHAGELARLLNVDSREINDHRLGSALLASKTFNSIVILKGDDTLVVDSEGTTAISQGGAPGLATAGSGDVLAGVIGALLARGVKPWQASCASVFVHLQSGRMAGEQLGVNSVVASDVVDLLPQAFLGKG